MGKRRKPTPRQTPRAKAKRTNPKAGPKRRRRNPASTSGMNTDMLARIGYQMLGALLGDMMFDLSKRGKKKGKAKLVCMCGKEHDPSFCPGRPEDYVS